MEDIDETIHVSERVYKAGEALDGAVEGDGFNVAAVIRDYYRRARKKKKAAFWKEVYDYLMTKECVSKSTLMFCDSDRCSSSRRISKARSAPSVRQAACVARSYRACARNRSARRPRTSPLPIGRAPNRHIPSNNGSLRRGRALPAFSARPNPWPGRRPPGRCDFRTLHRPGRESTFRSSPRGRRRKPTRRRPAWENLRSTSRPPLPSGG